MDFNKTLDQLNRSEISFSEVVNDVLNKAQNESERIKMYIDDIDIYLYQQERDLKRDFFSFLVKVFNENLTTENTKSIKLTYMQKKTLKICKEKGFKSLKDIPYVDYDESSDLFPLHLEIKNPFINVEKMYLHQFVKVFEPFESLELVYFLKDTLKKYIEPKQETDQIIKPTPFKDLQTKELFEYIVNYWDNKNATKWGYIWEYLYTKDNGKLTNKTDYETYLRKHYDFTTGKPNYESCNSEKRYLELDNLKTQFIENLDLN